MDTALQKEIINTSVNFVLSKYHMELADDTTLGNIKLDLDSHAELHGLSWEITHGNGDMTFSASKDGDFQFTYSVKF